jgi:hypothetical protein
MRRTIRLAAGVLLGLLAVLVGCGSGADDGTGVATAGDRASASADAAPRDDREPALRFAKCVRENGVPDFPDPVFNDSGGRDGHAAVGPAGR